MLKIVYYRADDSISLNFLKAGGEKMKHKRIGRAVSAILAAALLTGVSAGCQSNPATATTSTGSTTATASAASTAAQKDVTLTLTGCSGNGWVYPVDKTVIEDFTKETGIKVDVQITPADQYASLIKTKLASGDGPDIVMIWPEANASQFLPEKNFLDLSNESWVSNLTDEAKTNQSYNGKVIGWGAQGGDYGWGVIYNKDIFAKSNLSVPKNFKDFLAACEKIQATGVTPFFGTLKDQWSPGIWMANMGTLAETQTPGLYDKLNNNTAKFADVKVFEQFINDYKTLYDKGYLGKNSLSGTVDNGVTSVVNGKAAMALVNCTPDGWVSSLGLKADMSKFAMFPAPFADNKSLTSYDGSIIRAINKNSKNIDACKKYLEFISKPEELTKYYAEADRSTIAPGFKDFAAKFKWSDNTKSLIANSDGKKHTIMETGIKYWDNTIEGKYIVEAILGTKTAKEALQAMDNDRSKLFVAADQK
jgi:raffinose/stachyose/melibiose transport system substrate-binding protein